MNPEPPLAPAGLVKEPPPLEPPPILGSWERMYALVLGVFCAVVLLLYFLTRVYK
jgi:hypothetical protein